MEDQNGIWRFPIIRYDFHSSRKQTRAQKLFIIKFAEIKQEYPISLFQIIYTDGSKKYNRVGSAAIIDRGYLSECLPDKVSIFCAKLRAIVLAFKYIDR